MIQRTHFPGSILLLVFWSLCGGSVTLRAQFQQVPQDSSALFDPVPLPTEIAWERFSDVDGRFRILVPGEFTDKVDTIHTPIGPLAYHTFFYNDPKGVSNNLFYMVSYCDYPPSSVHSDSTDLVEDFFQQTIEAAVESVHGTELYRGESSVQGFPGRNWRIDYLDGKAVIRTRAFLVQRRYYAIQTISLAEPGLNLEATKFLDSFRLLSAGD